MKGLQVRSHYSDGGLSTSVYKPGFSILTQNALDGIMLDELDVGQSDLSSCGLHK